MYPDRSLALGPVLSSLGLSLVLAACGGHAESGMVVDFVRDQLLADAVSLEIRLYRRGSDCPALRTTRPRPAPVLGPFRLMLDEAERQAGTIFSTQDIPAGTYTVLVDALNASGGSAGSGCTPEGVVTDGEISRIRVTIADDP